MERFSIRRRSPAKEFTSNVRKILHLTSDKTMTKTSGILIQNLMTVYLKEAMQSSTIYADKQGKDIIDGECFSAVEEMLIQKFS